MCTGNVSNGLNLHSNSQFRVSTMLRLITFPQQDAPSHKTGTAVLPDSCAKRAPSIHPQRQEQYGVTIVRQDGLIADAVKPKLDESSFCTCTGYPCLSLVTIGVRVSHARVKFVALMSQSMAHSTQQLQYARTTIITNGSEFDTMPALRFKSARRRRYSIRTPRFV